jgi:inosine/xanthosine triphosphate pyrophosphatase family protein
MGRSRKKPPRKKIKVVYATSNKFKQEENQAFAQNCELDGTPVTELFEFDFREIDIPERLEVDLTVMVREEVQQAYRRIQVPCIVEHAGLVFEDYRDSWYPGGLTKPMWNVLGDRFLKETNSAGRRAIARAVVGYCDGMQLRTFVGETAGTLADKARGSRHFYWDTVFIPDDSSGTAKGKTYAEICDDPSLGLAYKMAELSQSGRAMLEFLAFLRENPQPQLWNL